MPPIPLATSTTIEIDQALLEVLPQGLALFGPDARLYGWNRAFHEMAAVGPLNPDSTLKDVLRCLPGPRGCASAAEWLDPLWSGERRLPLTRIDLPDGRIWEVRLNPLSDQRMALILTDITEMERRSRHHSRLAELVNLTPLPILVLDPQERVLMWNRAFMTMNPRAQLELGIPFEDMLIRYAETEMSWSSGDPTPDWVAERLSQHRNYRGPFEEIMGPEERWFLTSEHTAGDGTTLIMHLDITAQKRAEQAALQGRDLADKANRAKSEFLANMSHELRTPLNAVMGFSEVLRDQLLGPIGDPRYVEYAGDIHDSGAHLLDLVNTILDLSKIEAGQFDLTENWIDVAAEIHSTLRLIDMRAHEAGVRLKTTIEPDMPAFRADRRAIRQMVLNLLSNAVRFTSVGGRVEVCLCRRNGQDLVMRVADTGIGIAAEDLSRVLEPFFQVTAAQTVERGGTGLGLPLVKALTERHGGTFALDSEQGVGTTVTLTLPAERFRHAKTGRA